MSDVQVMKAIIQQHTKADYNAEVAAKALYAAGFRMKVDDTTSGLIARLRDAEGRLTRLEGWSGLPPL